MKTCIRIKEHYKTRIWTSFATVITRTSTKNNLASNVLQLLCANLDVVTALWGNEYISPERVFSVTRRGPAIANVASSRTSPVHSHHSCNECYVHIGVIVQRATTSQKLFLICASRRCRNVWTIRCCCTLTIREHTFWTCKQCWRASLASRSVDVASSQRIFEQNDIVAVWCII